MFLIASIIMLISYCVSIFMNKSIWKHFILFHNVGTGHDLLQFFGGMWHGFCDSCCKMTANPRANFAAEVIFVIYASAQNSTEAKGFHI